ncbi:MAG: hypothetical protein AAB445_03040 [Patescibacteria group bacterium]
MTPKTGQPINSKVLAAVQSLSVSVDKRFAAADSRSNEIMEAIHVFAESIDRRFDAVDKRFDKLEGRLGKVESGMSGMVTKDFLETRLQKFQTTMVTKDYLDTKLANLEGNLIVLTRKEDQKLHTLVDILHDKNVIDDNDVRRVERLEPFAR